VIQCNPFFAHPENLLISMITSHGEHGIRHILKARYQHSHSHSLLQLNKLFGNFDNQDSISTTVSRLLDYQDEND